MFFIDEMKVVQTFNICKSETFLNDTVYCEYGITLNSIGDNGHVHSETIERISTDERIVEALVQRMMNDFVDPITLQYVVEDYLGEIFGM